MSPGPKWFQFEETKPFNFIWHLLIPARLSQEFPEPSTVGPLSVTDQKESLEEWEEDIIIIIIIFAILNIFGILHIVRINNVLVKWYTVSVN